MTLMLSIDLSHTQARPKPKPCGHAALRPCHVTFKLGLDLNHLLQANQKDALHIQGQHIELQNFQGVQSKLDKTYAENHHCWNLVQELENWVVASEHMQEERDKLENKLKDESNKENIRTLSKHNRCIGNGMRGMTLRCPYPYWNMSKNNINSLVSFKTFRLL